MYLIKSNDPLVIPGMVFLLPGEHGVTLKAVVISVQKFNYLELNFIGSLLDALGIVEPPKNVTYYLYSSNKENKFEEAGKYVAPLSEFLMIAKPLFKESKQ